MLVLQEILEWSENRPKWQQDALRRLVVNGELTEADVVELTRICKAQYVLDDPELPAPDPIPLGPEHLPALGVAVPSVCLLGIREVTNVNALAGGQHLTFAPNGITIVYGDNATGKSGYARILRHVCRARARGEAILPNVFNGTATGPATATIEYRVGDADRTVRWQIGQPSPPELAAVSFFDSACASVHVRGANGLAFTPFGLDLLPTLVSACQQISASLMRDYSLLEQAKPASLQQPQAKEGTEVRSSLDTLIAASADIAYFERLAELSEGEETRVSELRESLADDPRAAARVLRVRQGRVQRFAEEVAQVGTGLGDDAVARIRCLLEDAVVKEDAARLAALKAFGDQPLPHVGSEVWSVLWESARRYSETAAYPNQQFPVTEGDARCVLCQQPLSADAAVRLRRFENFIREDTQQIAQNARRELASAVELISALGLRRRDYVDSLNDVILEDKQLADLLRRFIVQAHLRRRHILLSCKRSIWSEPLTLPDSPTDPVAALSQGMCRRVQQLDLAATSAESERLQRELDGLLARRWLSSVLDDVRTEINRQQKLSKLASANNETTTTWITRKNSELTDQYVTETLCRRFADEARRLGAGYLQVQLEAVGGQYGSKLFCIRLNGAQQAANVPAVLSEGEYRCIALAGFLSELATSDSNSGLVFDDPVCSLDHRWRHRVVKRLVEEAQVRQVVIFTHDVAFLLDLTERCQLRGVPCVQSQLERDQRQTGLCVDGVPWVSMKVKDRLGCLREDLQSAEAVYNRSHKDYEPLARLIYERLREAWERGVEEVLLNGAVVRFGRPVHTQQLRPLHDITPDDIRAVVEGMTEASRVLHDQPGATNEPMPDPEELLSDIQALDQWVSAIRKRRK